MVIVNTEDKKRADTTADEAKQAADKLIEQQQKTLESMKRSTLQPKKITK